MMRKLLFITSVALLFVPMLVLCALIGAVAGVVAVFVLVYQPLVYEWELLSHDKQDV